MLSTRFTPKIAIALLGFSLTACGPQVGGNDVDGLLTLKDYFSFCGNIVKLEQREVFCNVFSKSIYGKETSSSLEGVNAIRSILIPSNTAVQAYLQKLGVTESQFLGSAQADDLVKRSVIQGRPLENTTANTLTGTSVSFTKSGDKLLANGKGVVTGNAPDLEKLRSFYFYRTDAVLE